MLSHYEAVIWYTGDDSSSATPARRAGTGTSALAQDEIVNVRDYLNEGGKLLYTGKNAADGQLTGVLVQPGRPAAVRNQAGVDPLRRTRSPTLRCAVLNDDFLQYWLGAYVHINAANDNDGGQRAEPVQRRRSVRR